MKSGDPSRQLEFVIYSLSRLMSRLYNDRYCEIDSNGTRIAALIHLERSKEGLIQSEIAERLNMGKAAVGTMFDHLEKDGLVVRTASPEDRRVRIVQITDSGRDLVSIAEDATKDIRLAIRQGTTKEQRSALIDMLEQLRQNLVRLDESHESFTAPDLKKRHKRSNAS